MHALAAASSSGAGSAVLGVLLIAFGIAAYWVPTVVAGTRHVPNLGSVAVINGFLGWTVVGWVVALAMACRSRPPQPAGTPPRTGAGWMPPP
jgi:Superinfection immunity protein